MKPNKDILIKEYLERDYQVGDYVFIKDSRNDSILCKVIEILDSDKLIIKSVYFDKKYRVDKFSINGKHTGFVGANPFSQFRSKVKFSNFGLDSILSAVGYDRRKQVFKTEKFNNIEVPEVNWNPYIMKNGTKEYYQRDFVWTLKDKKLLIESIYNGIDCGKIILRKYSWKYVESQANEGNSEIAFKDIVDGKQRLNALLDFVNDKFMDIYGNYYSDLSSNAQNDFMNYQGFAYGELDENTTDEETIRTFLMINFSGTPQSEDHINFVKQLL